MANFIESKDGNETIVVNIDRICYAYPDKKGTQIKIEGLNDRLITIAMDFDEFKDKIGLKKNDVTPRMPASDFFPQ